MHSAFQLTQSLCATLETHATFFSSHSFHSLSLSLATTISLRTTMTTYGSIPFSLFPSRAQPRPHESPDTRPFPLDLHITRFQTINIT
jgi:hypothetical protein